MSLISFVSTGESAAASGTVQLQLSGFLDSDWTFLLSCSEVCFKIFFFSSRCVGGAYLQRSRTVRGHAWNLADFVVYQFCKPSLV